MMRPCPHCGSEEVELLGMELEYWVGCLNCHAAGPLCRTKEEAEQKWCAKNEDGGCANKDISAV